MDDASCTALVVYAPEPLHGLTFDAVEGSEWATALVRADLRQNYGEARLLALGFIGDRLFSLAYTFAASPESSACARRSTRRSCFMRAKDRLNTQEEQAAIKAGIYADPDNPEWTDGDCAAARPAGKMMSPKVYAGLTRKRRGSSKQPARVAISLQVPPDVAAGLRASGPGWQARAGEVSAKLVSF